MMNRIHAGGSQELFPDREPSYHSSDMRQQIFAALTNDGNSIIRLIPSEYNSHINIVLPCWPKCGLKLCDCGCIL